MILLSGKIKATPSQKKTQPRRTRRRSLRRSQMLQRKTRKKTMQRSPTPRRMMLRRATQQRRMTLPRKKAVLQRSLRILSRPRKRPRKPR